MLKDLHKFRVMLSKYYLLSCYLIAKNQITRVYRNSFLGTIWTLVQPTVQILVYGYVFSIITRFPIANYAIYLVTSIILWNFINLSLTTATTSLLWNADTIKRCLISKTIFPIANSLKCFYNFIISFAILYVLVSIFYQEFSFTILLVPVYLIFILTIIFSTSIALAFATPYIRDIAEFLTIGLNFAFWLTPIVYPIEAMSEKWQFVQNFNPFYIMLRPFLEIVYHQHIPSYFSIISLLTLTIISVIVSYSIYKICRKNFIFYL